MDLKKHSPEYFASLSPKKEAKFTFELKLEHIKAAREKKIYFIESKTKNKLSEEQRAAVTLTGKEYDQFRDPLNSLPAENINKNHGWNYALEMAGLPLALRMGEPYTPGEMRRTVLDACEDFKLKNGRYPLVAEYAEMSRKLKLPSAYIIKSTTGLSIHDYLVSLGIHKERRGGQANQEYYPGTNRSQTQR